VKSAVTEEPNSRIIFALMGFAVAFSLVGNEVKAVTTPKTGSTGVVTVAGKIVLGGFFATSLLVLISHAGDPGRQIGVGLATVAALSSSLVYGGPVWGQANALFGTRPTTPLATATANTVGTDVTLATGVSPKTATTIPTGVTQ
jgi:hypothetical protein